METKTKSTVNARTGKPKISSRGGARPNAGRPKGSVDRVTIEGLLTAVQNRANGRPYVELLAEDFHEARENHDGVLTMKYHNLILNKVAATLSTVELTDNTDALEQKKAAFAEALRDITGIKQ